MTWCGRELVVALYYLRLVQVDGGFSDSNAHTEHVRTPVQRA